MCTALQFSIYVAKCSKLSVTDLFTLMENLNHWALIPNEFKHERELLVELEGTEAFEAIEAYTALFDFKVCQFVHTFNAYRMYPLGKY